MHVLQVHNQYQQRGGEDVVARTESDLLRRAGIQVTSLYVDNSAIRGISSKICAAVNAIGSPSSYRNISSALRATAPDIVHFHNTFPILSPSAVLAALEADLPVVQTLHNYRLLCAAATFSRNGSICEQCVKSGTYLPSVLRRCYRNSAVGSAIVSETGRRFRKLFNDFDQQYTLIALTNFAKRKFTRAGFDESRVVVKGNTIHDPGAGSEQRQPRIIYLGRLSAEKGLGFLVDLCRDHDFPLELIGDGPLRGELQSAAGRRTIFRGWLEPGFALDLIKNSAALILPSTWYEGFPMVVLEGLATATPLLVSDIGALPELVHDEVSGRVLPVEDAGAWASAISDVLGAEGYARQLGQRGRQEYMTRFGPEVNVRTLTKIYQRVLERGPT